MRIQAYLRILSDEDTIRAIEKKAGIPNARTAQLKGRRKAPSEEMWWNWETARIPIDTDNPDDGLRALLLAHRPIFPIIKKHEGSEADIYLEVITEYQDGEEPSGLFLSAETIQLLSEMGGALDNDVVILAEKAHDG